MKKKEIHSNAIVSFKTNNETNFSISYSHYDKGDKGYPSGMHLADKIKPKELNYIHIKPLFFISSSMSTRTCFLANIVFL